MGAMIMLSVSLEKAKEPAVIRRQVKIVFMKPRRALLIRESRASNLAYATKSSQSSFSPVLHSGGT
jgi:hypothetical protein